MKYSKHATNISERFRELVESSGESLSENHYDELSLLIESGIDAALVEVLEKIANKVEGLAHEIRSSAEDVN